MSDVLARIRVKEEHGIRRFLYPLSAQIELPAGMDYEKLGIATRDNDIDWKRVQLVDEEGLAVPLDAAHVGQKDEHGIETGRRYKLDFAVSQGPFEEKEYSLCPSCAPTASFSDFLHLNRTNSNSELVSTQRHFCITLQDGYSGKSLTSNQPIKSVVYDGVSHLRDSLTITRNALNLEAKGAIAARSTTINASAGVFDWVDEGGVRVISTTRTQITACKSWAAVFHRFEKPEAGDRFTFSLPLATSSDVLTCDFGVGGGTFGKLERGKAEEVVWQTEFKGNLAHWSLATAGRTDYVGQTLLQAFRSQSWFHLIDSDKALAVAITKVPASCREIVVSLNTIGDVIITFRLGEPSGAAEFGVCYHFLNGIPAIAAATNPQSILLPPIVEVLPA